MRWIRRHRPSPASGIAFAALVVALGGVAFATIPDSTGTINACYQKRNGDLRVVEASDDCRSRERPLAWNQTGPTGPQGPSGDDAITTRSGSAVPTEETILFDIDGFAKLTLRLEEYDGLPANHFRVVQTWTNKQAGARLYLSGASTPGGPKTVEPGATYVQDNFLPKSGPGGSLGDILIVGSGDRVARSELGIFEVTPSSYFYGFHLSSSAG